jgi:hypothetical protein
MNDLKIEHSTPLVNDIRNDEMIDDFKDNQVNKTKNGLSERYNNHSSNNKNNNNSHVNNFAANILPLNSNNNNNNNHEKQHFPRKTNIQFNSYLNTENTDTIQPLPPSRDSTFYVQNNNNNNNKVIRNHSSLTNENIIINSVRFFFNYH